MGEVNPRTRAVWRAHNDAQRHYFEDQPKPNMLPRRSRYLERHVDELLTFAGLGPDDRVLEVGCGLGRYTLPLAARGLRVTGIDIAGGLLDRLQDRLGDHGSINLVEGDVASPPAALPRDFDAAIGFFVLHHMHDLAACMRGVANLVRPGGRVAFLEPNAYNPLYYVQIFATPTMSWAGDGGVTAMRPRHLADVMSNAGLVDVRLDRFGFLPPWVTERPRGAALERRLEKLPGLGPVLPFQMISARRLDE